MRHDMSSVIVERPRRDGSTGKGRQREWDDLPSHEGMSRPYTLLQIEKVLSDNLSPLRRFLAKQVGRPWDNVYSEITARLHPDNALQQHVRDHLKDLVAVKPAWSLRRDRYVARFGPWYQKLYVDPEDGILKRTADLPELKAARRAMRSEAAPLPDRVPLGRGIELRRLDGLWYEVRLAELPKPHYVAVTEEQAVAPERKGRSRPDPKGEAVVRRLTTPPVHDGVSGAVIAVGPEFDEPQAWSTYRRSHPVRWYAVAKRRLSRRELRRHGLEDRPLQAGR